jgi:hypothetical protein
VDALCLFDESSLRITSVNASWSTLFGYSPADAAGRDVCLLAAAPDEMRRRLSSGSTRELHYQARGLFRKANGATFSSDFTLTSHAVAQTRLVCMLVESPSPMQRVPGLSVVEEEVISETGVPSHLKAAMRERVERCSRQQAALLRLASLDDHDFGELTRKLLRTDAETLGIARVSYWMMNQGTSIVCQALYDQTKGGFESGLELTASDYPKYFEALVTGALIPAHDACVDPRTSEFADGYLRPLGIGAMLDIPVFMRGDLVGIVCHEHIGPPRGWTMDEQQFALSVGQLFSLALSSRHRDLAARSIRQRETALAEANVIVDRALRPDDGRLTGRTVGRYKMGQILGRGGMGEVYRATRVEDGAFVAIKVLRRNKVTEPAHVQRFLREARLTQAVPSEHVPRVDEFGTFDDGSPFIAMELLEGHDLAWHLRRSPELPLDQVLELVDHAARALDAVHVAGVVHRDLKPSNLFLVDALPRAWKVLDFGISQSFAEVVAPSDEMVGTPQYMAPEQMNGDAIDHRADLYALATIAFRALCGRPPFVGDMQALLVAVVSESVPRISELAEGLHPSVDYIFAIALAKDPADRFPSAIAFAQALRLATIGHIDDMLLGRGVRLLATPTAY